MTKVLFLLVPVVFVIVAVNLFNNKRSASDPSSCSLSAKEYLDANKEDAIILDVRTAGEFAQGHLEKAIDIDIYGSNFKQEIAKLDKNKKYYVYCKTGMRSRNAVNYMVQNGFKNVCNIEGGINYLSRAGVKLVQ